MLIEFRNFIGRWAKRSPAGALLHVALLLILIGALMTCFSARQGSIVITTDKVSDSFMADDGGAVHQLPFGLRLGEAEVVYHDGSTAPKDFKVAAEVTSAGHDMQTLSLSMNHVLDIEGYRFCLKQFDGDDVVLSVNHDPVGIAVTYAGYYLLFACSLWFLVGKAIRGMRGKRVCAAAFAVLTLCSAQASEVSDAFGRIRVYWGERPAAMETMCGDLLSRIYGKDSYNGKPATEVLLGWLFEYDAWMREPIIKVKGEKVRNTLGIDGKYASYRDFFDAGGYKLEPLLGDLDDKDVQQVDERVKLMSAWCAGTLMKIYPYHTASGRWEWLTPVDSKPSKMPLDQWTFVSTSFNDVARYVSLDNPAGAVRELESIANYQRNQLPSLSESKLDAELFYGRFCGTLMPGVLAIVIGLCCMFVWRDAKLRRAVVIAASMMLWLWLSVMVGLRWYLTGHFPLANGFETMQAMAWMAALGAVCVSFRRVSDLRSAAVCMLVSGLALMVCTMGGGNSISPLMPVLGSSLLSVHVLIIMAAYCLTAIMFVNSVWGLAVRGETAAKCCAASLRLLEPAVLLLACGIFVGAIWANMSWGRYWGWDPKETWALITMLVYSVPLHRRFIPLLRSPRAINIYFALAFICVLMTYFGVNFFLGGMHSYA